jgi:hypothetical protein
MFPKILLLIRDRNVKGVDTRLSKKPSLWRFPIPIPKFCFEKGIKAIPFGSLVDSVESKDFLFIEIKKNTG